MAPLLQPGDPVNLEDPAAFDELYGTHACYVRAIASRVLKDSAAVEDVVQDVFLQVWRQGARYDPARGDVRAWLTVITRSRALDRLRRQGRWPAGDWTAALDNAEAEGHDPSRLAELTEGIARVRGAWASLPPLTRQMLELAYDDNISQRDIAERTDETLGIVKSRLRQGLRTLKTHASHPGHLPSRSEPSEWALTTTDLADVPEASVTLPSLRGLRVMVVDDDFATCEVLGALLTRAGASPIVRRSAAEACCSLQDDWPDVLLSDISMPGQDGYSLLSQAQAIASRSGRCLAAIAFTARCSEWERTRALRAGFQLYLSKPVHPLAVLTAIGRLAGVAGRREPGLA